MKKYRVIFILLLSVGMCAGCQQEISQKKKSCYNKCFVADNLYNKRTDNHELSSADYDRIGTV